MWGGEGSFAILDRVGRSRLCGQGTKKSDGQIESRGEEIRAALIVMIVRQHEEVEDRKVCDLGRSGWQERTRRGRAGVSMAGL